jgi:hypothetical protein
MIVRLILLLSALAVSPPTPVIELTWDYDYEQAVWDQRYPVTFRVYQSESVTGPYEVKLETTNRAVNLELPYRGRFFFYVTASNFWGESWPSNTNNTPMPAGVPKTLNLRRPESP